jgi:hypothetical protein
VLNKGLLYLLIATLALLVSPGLPQGVAAQPNIVVDDNWPTTCTSAPFAFATITAALAAAGNGDTIQVCAGNYTEDTLNINVSVTITGPGATSADDGVATLHHSLGGSSDMVIISTDSVTFEGLDLDATPPTGWFFTTSGISGSGNYVTIQDNEIRNATSSAVGMGGATFPTNINILRNNVHDNGSGISCYCDDSGLWSNTVDAGGATALTLNGDRGTIGGNVVTNGTVSAMGNDLVVQNNQISAGTAGSTLYVSGSPVTVTGNDLSDADYYGVEATPQTSLSTSVTIARNTFTDIRVPINLSDWDPNDAFGLTATIGGSPSEANTFVGSGGILGDLSYLVEMDGPTANVNAQYNNWGLCTLAEIEQEIYDHADDPAQGAVDYDPFIAPSSCSTTPTPTATPTPTPTPTATPGPTATPIPGGTRAVTIPAGSWANFAWTGDSSPQTIADCFGAGNVVVMYRLDATTQTFERWIRDRQDLSNMGEVQTYETLLALNTSAQPATCNMPSELFPRSLTIPAQSWANFAWTGDTIFPAEGAAQCFGEGNIAVIYRLDATTQTFQRWVRGRPELSTMEAVEPYDALLALNSGDQPATCEFPT